MSKVKFVECDDDQARFGRGSDPRDFLEIGKEYTLVDKEIHSWHTLYYLQGFNEGFNSVCFEDVDKDGMNEEITIEDKIKSILSKADIHPKRIDAAYLNKVDYSSWSIYTEPSKPRATLIVWADDINKNGDDS